MFTLQKIAVSMPNEQLYVAIAEVSFPLKSYIMRATITTKGLKRNIMRCKVILKYHNRLCIKHA